MNKILVHIPHSSLKVTKTFKNKLLISNEEFNNENMFLCDYEIDKYVPRWFNTVKFKYSRMMCDVERYRDNNAEEMAKYGMGYIYTYTSSKKKILDIDEKHVKYIDKIDEKHHKKIDNKTSKLLDKYNECILIDLHSYSDELVLKLFNKRDNPDICIGINKYYDKKLLNYTVEYFKKYNYSAKINYPYSGSLIPNRYIDDKRVKSIMIEVNKRIYSTKLKKIMFEYFFSLKD